MKNILKNIDDKFQEIQNKNLIHFEYLKSFLSTNKVWLAEASKRYLEDMDSEIDRYNDKVNPSWHLAWLGIIRNYQRMIDELESEVGHHPLMLKATNDGDIKLNMYYGTGRTYHPINRSLN